LRTAGTTYGGNLAIRNDAVVDGQQIAGDFAHRPGHHTALLVDAPQLRRFEAIVAACAKRNVSSQARTAGLEQRASITHAFAHDVAAAPYTAQGPQNRQR